MSTTTRSFYGEHDELEVWFAVADTSFVGEVRTFDDHRKLNSVSLALAGFPKHAGDVAEFDFGLFERVKVTLLAGSRGQVDAKVVFEKPEGRRANGNGESLLVRLKCDASSVDDFCRALSAARPHEPLQAILAGRP